MTGIAFISICHAALFYELVDDFENNVTVLAAAPTRTLKSIFLESARGIWGMANVQLSPQAAHALKKSSFLEIAAEKVRVFLFF